MERNYETWYQTYFDELLIIIGDEDAEKDINYLCVEYPDANKDKLMKAIANLKNTLIDKNITHIGTSFELESRKVQHTIRINGERATFEDIETYYLLIQYWPKKPILDH